MEGLLEDVTEQGLQGVGGRPCILERGTPGRAQPASAEVREVADELQSSSHETRENPAHHDSQPSLAPPPRRIRVGVLTPGWGLSRGSGCPPP